MHKILLAEDDIELSELLVEFLQPEGFAVIPVYDGQQAVESAIDQTFDVIILDVMMPKLNGFDVLREIRNHQPTPILMLTARGEDIDRIVGLEMGADDYLAKPCNPRELVARLRAILRRTHNQTATHQSPEKVVVGDISLDLGTRTVMRAKEEIILTSTEFNVLEVLLRHAGNVVSKETLMEKALSRKLTAFDRSMDMHVSNIRKKLGSNPDNSQRIKTIRGVGYQYIASQ